MQTITNVLNTINEKGIKGLLTIDTLTELCSEFGSSKLVIVDNNPDHVKRKLYDVISYNTASQTFNVVDVKASLNAPKFITLNIDAIEDHVVVEFSEEKDTWSLLTLENSDTVYCSTHRYNLLKGIMSLEDKYLFATIEVVAYNSLFKEYQSFYLIVRDGLVDYDNVISHFINKLPSYFTDNGMQITCAVNVPEVKVNTTFKTFTLNNNNEGLELSVVNDKNGSSKVLDIDNIYSEIKAYKTTLKQQKSKAKTAVTNNLSHKGNNHVKGVSKALA